MTKYVNDTFSVPLGGEAYAAGFERTFGARTDRDCTRCLGRGEVAHVECDDCSGTGLRAYQKSASAP